MKIYRQMQMETWRCGPGIPKACRDVKQRLTSLFPVYPDSIIEELNAKLLSSAKSEEEYANRNTVDQRLQLLNGDAKNNLQLGSLNVFPKSLGNSGTVTRFSRLEDHSPNHPFKLENNLKYVQDKHVLTGVTDVTIPNSKSEAELGKWSNYSLGQFSFGYDFSDSRCQALDAAKEIEGKGPGQKEQDSIKKPTRNSGSAVSVVRKFGERAKVTLGSGNDNASQSADSGSQGGLESSDENTNQREVSGMKKKSFNQMLVEGANGKNNDTFGYSGDVVLATVPWKPVGSIPGTNLNMGMDLWITSPVGTIPLRAVTVPSKMAGRVGVPADHVWIQQDERELKRQRTKQSNQESAKRSKLCMQERRNQGQGVSTNMLIEPVSW